MSNSLRLKLIMFSFGSILLTLFVAGVSIDVLLAGLYGENAEHESEHAYELIYEKIKNIENNLIDQSRLISKDPAVVAPVNLVNRYQSIKKYEPLIFDDEKKSLANHLLKRTSTFQQAQTAIYNKKGYLIAFSAHNGLNNIVGITTYKNNKAVYLSKNIKETNWKSKQLPPSIDSRLRLKENINSFVYQAGVIEYSSNPNDFIISSFKTIQRDHIDGSTEIVGYIKIKRSFNGRYIKELSGASHVNVSLVLANDKIINNQDELNLPYDLDKHSSLFGSTQISNKAWLENNKYFIQSYVLPVVNGKLFLLLSQSRAELQAALNKSRYLLLLIFLVIALLIIPFGIYWLNKRVSEPLNILTKQLAEIEKNEYPDFYISESKDEISLLGNGLNNMVAVIKSREESLKASQIDLNEAQHLSKIGSWKLNSITNHLEWSDELFEIFEMDPELVKPSFDSFLDIVFPEDKNVVNAAYINSIKNKQPFDLIHRIQMKNGDIKYLRAHSELILDEQANVLFAKGTVQDITEQKLNDELLTRTQKMDALGKLTGGIAHDFNNMLGVILGYSELLQNMLIGDKNKLKYIEHVIDASQRASALTKKLLSFSRKEAATIENVDINESLLDDRNLLEKTLTSRIELVYELGKDIWKVSLDKSDLQNAILNMSINAMHAMQNTGKLVIQTENINLDKIDSKSLNLKSGDYVQLSITDTGMGMNEEIRSKLFDPFFSTKGEKGTGLGMSQVYGFIQQTGGNIHVFSQPGYGTRIVIYLPRSSEHRNSVQHKDADINEKIETGTETILVVDDEESLREYAMEILSENNYNVLCASNGIEAIKLLETESVDLVLTDVIMPEMDGYQLATKIKTLYPHIKIQVASGFSDDLTLDITNEKLHQLRLQKPFTSKVLLRKIRDLLDEDLAFEDNSGAKKISLPIEWSAKYSSGIDVIDDDHKVLIELINKCDDVVNNEKSENMISSILHDLLNYVDYHFKREEILMKMCGFQDTAKHKRLHENLSINVNEYIKEYGSGKLTADSLLNSLINWLVNHIVGHDLPMAFLCKDKVNIKELQREFKEAGYE